MAGGFNRRELFRNLGRAISDFRLIRPGDSVLLGISGGKDSLLMAWLLADILQRSPVKFRLGAVTVDPGEPLEYSRAEIENLGAFLSGLGIEFHVVPSSIARIVEAYPTKKTACSLCANLRRGALHKTAQELGFNKVALAHHLDDAIETLFLNMFYQGSLRCFRPSTFLTRRQIEVIRPMVYIPERDIVAAVGALGLPVVKTRCPVAGNTTRQSMKELVARLASEIPGFRNQMRGVLRQLWLSTAEEA